MFLLFFYINGSNEFSIKSTIFQKVLFEIKTPQNTKKKKNKPEKLIAKVINSETLAKKSIII